MVRTENRTMINVIFFLQKVDSIVLSIRLESQTENDVIIKQFRLL